MYAFFTIYRHGLECIVWMAAGLNGCVWVGGGGLVRAILISPAALPLFCCAAVILTSLHSVSFSRVVCSGTRYASYLGSYVWLFSSYYLFKDTRDSIHCYTNVMSSLLWYEPVYASCILSYCRKPTMVQNYQSPVRVYKYPFELVMKVRKLILAQFVGIWIRINYVSCFWTSVIELTNCN